MIYTFSRLAMNRSFLKAHISLLQTTNGYVLRYRPGM